jgi:nitrogen-specific signal transduction histidine kinase
VEITAQETSDGIRVTVADNGSGIAESIRDRLFHPFVSYGKENGTGLGLAVVLKIVQDHGGQITVERRANKTVFQVVLPGRGREPNVNLASGEKLTSFVPVQQDQANETSISRPGP